MYIVHLDMFLILIPEDLKCVGFVFFPSPLFCKLNEFKKEKVFRKQGDASVRKAIALAARALMHAECQIGHLFTYHYFIKGNEAHRLI